MAEITKMFLAKRLKILFFQVILLILFLPVVLLGQDFLKYLRVFQVTPVQKAGGLVLCTQTERLPIAVYLIDIPQDTIVFYKPLEGSFVATKFFDKQNMIYIASNIQSSGYVQMCKLSNPKSEEQREISREKLLYVYFFNDSRRMAYVDQNYKFYIVNLDNGEVELNLADTTDETIYAFNVTRDEKAIALLGGSRIIILDADGKRIQKEFPLYSYHMEKVYLTNNRKFVIKYGYDKRLKIIDIENDTIFLDTTKFEADVHSCQTNETDEYLFCLFKGGILRVYNFPKFEQIWSFPLLGHDFVVENEGSKVYVIGRVNSYLPPSPLLTMGIVKFDIISKDYKLIYHFLYAGLFGIDLTNDYLIQRFVKGFRSSIVKYYVFNLNTGKFIKELDTNITCVLDSFTAPVFRFIDNHLYYYFSDTLIIRDIASENVVSKYYLPDVQSPRLIKLSPNLRYIFYLTRNNDCPKVVDLTSNTTVFTFKNGDSCINMFFDHIFENQSPLQRQTPQLVYFSNNGKFLGYLRLNEKNEKFFEIINLHNGENVFQKKLDPQFKFFFYFDPDEEQYFYFRFRYDSLPLAKYNLEKKEITFFEDNPRNYYYSRTSYIYKIPRRNLLMEIYYSAANTEFKFWDTEKLKYVGGFPLKSPLGVTNFRLFFFPDQDNSPMLYYMDFLVNFFAIYVDSLINNIKMDTSSVTIVPERVFRAQSQAILSSSEDEIELILPEVLNPDANTIKLVDIFSKEIEISGRVRVFQNRIFVSLKGLSNGIYCLVVGKTPYNILKISK